ncbi:MAG: hypothetical protein BWX63_02265 [Bacteroidetes bacterium ADurb.Bin041]|nr:MAG: hypothetical protein BWX63_02265 [Bacteroidetes bacterium ADurb.Bin041]
MRCCCITKLARKKTIGIGIYYTHQVIAIILIAQLVEQHGAATMMAITIEREYISIFIVSNLLFRTYARDDAISIIGRHWLNNSRGIKSGKKYACFQTVETIILKTISIHISVLVLCKPFYHGYLVVNLHARGLIFVEGATDTVVLVGFKVVIL